MSFLICAKISSRFGPFGLSDVIQVHNSVYIFSFRSSYGTLYQIPSKILEQLGPIIADSTSTDFTILESETVQVEHNLNLSFSVDLSIRRLMIEVTGSHIPSFALINPGMNLEFFFHNFGP